MGVEDLRARIRQADENIAAAKRERISIINNGLVYACLIAGVSFFAAAIVAERAFEREDRANQESVAWNR